MFNSKKTNLIGRKKQTSVTTTNSFVKKGLKVSSVAKSGNGAIKYSSTDNEFVNQFNQAGDYKTPRKFDDIATSMSTLWAIDNLRAVAFILYLRLITRIVTLFNGEKTSTTQRGTGLKHEAIMRFMWLGVYHPNTFKNNLHLLVSAGSWKDVFVLMRTDLIYNGWKDKVLDWNFLGDFILAGLENPITSELIKKYLPSIKANDACTTIESQANNIIGKYLCSRLFGTKMDDYTSYKKYRVLKSKGTAHKWQQLISKGLFKKIDFKTIHGRALAKLVSSKFLANHGLEKEYDAWIEKQPVAKFTGYVHELFEKINTLNKKYQITTLNKQFDGLVEKAKTGAKTSTGLIVVRDTSGSMKSPAAGTKMTAFDVAKAMALFLSQMLPDGAFSNAWIEFNSTAKMHTWKGSTAYEMWKNDKSSYVGSTNFQSVIDLFIKLLNQEVPESEFPSGIVCISDGQFNVSHISKSNVMMALNRLRSEGFSNEYVSNFQIILWDLPNDYYGNKMPKFETHKSTVDNVFYFSGYDASVIALLTGSDAQKDKAAPKNAAELVDAALEQELMDYIEI